MKRYFTSDWHLNGIDVIKFCGRPFKNIEQMNRTLINNANMRCGLSVKEIEDRIYKHVARFDRSFAFDDLCHVAELMRNFISGNSAKDKVLRNVGNVFNIKSDNVLYHVGDFFAYGNVKGTECAREDPQKYLDMLSCRVILVEGNHDKNNGLKTDCRGAQIKLAEYNVVTIGHFPSWYVQSRGIVHPHSVHICGHVHGLENGQWKYRYDTVNDILNINVCVDNWRMLPVCETEIIDYIYRIKKQLGFRKDDFTCPDCEWPKKEEEPKNGK